MKVFTRDYKIDHLCSPVFGEYYDGLKPCVLDIEATGLDPSRCKVILMGLLTQTDTGLRVTQFLAENHYEESKVLEATLDFLKDEGIDYLITFNGLRYDIPFINTRLEQNFLDEKIILYDFDLYRFLRKCSNLPKRLDSLSQASCEAFWGIAHNRKDTITGRESVAMFDEYALNGNPTLEKIILTHNREDVLQLHHLMRLAARNEYEEILDEDFHTAIAKYGFPVFEMKNSDDPNSNLSNNSDAHPLIKYCARPHLNANKKLLTITGDQLIDPIAAAYFPDIDNIVTATFNKTTASFELLVPVESYGDSFYIDITKIGFDEKSLNSFVNNPNFVNNYLILNAETINLFTGILLKKY